MTELNGGYAVMSIFLSFFVPFFFFFFIFILVIAPLTRKILPGVHIGKLGNPEEKYVLQLFAQRQTGYHLRAAVANRKREGGREEILRDDDITAACPHIVLMTSVHVVKARK